VDRVQEARVTLTVENYRHIAEIRFNARGQDFIAASESADMSAAADQVIDRLERQLRRFKDRRLRRRRDGRTQPPVAEEAMAVEMPPLTRHDQVSSRPMSVDDAMTLLDEEGGEYLVFANTDTDKLTVLYRRQDGSYGLIEPSTLDG
jgi:putative sigma-54 modulation protein